MMPQASRRVAVSAVQGVDRSGFGRFLAFAGTDTATGIDTITDTRTGRDTDIDTNTDTGTDTDTDADIETETDTGIAKHKRATSAASFLEVPTLCRMEPSAAPLQVLYAAVDKPRR